MSRILRAKQPILKLFSLPRILNSSFSSSSYRVSPTAMRSSHLRMTSNSIVTWTEPSEASAAAVASPTTITESHCQHAPNLTSSQLEQYKTRVRRYDLSTSIEPKSLIAGSAFVKSSLSDEEGRGGRRRGSGRKGGMEIQGENTKKKKKKKKRGGRWGREQSEERGKRGL